MRFADWPNRTVPDQFAQTPRLFGRLALVAHLRGHLRCACRLGDLAGLPYQVGQRLLAVDVLAHLQCHDRREGVDMVRSGDDDGVNRVTHLVKHLAEVLVLLRLRETPEGSPCPSRIDIAQGDDVLLLELPDVAPSLTADADARDVESRARRRGAVESQCGAGDHVKGGGRQRHTAEESAAGDRREAAAGDLLIVWSSEFAMIDRIGTQAILWSDRVTAKINGAVGEDHE